MQILGAQPTRIEAGLHSLSLGAWAVLVAPASTPDETGGAPNRDVNAAIQMPAADDRFRNAGVDLRGDLSIQQVGDFIEAERSIWEQVIRRSVASAEYNATR
jgi:tripartite-type tricarboxylate transporter receptor subunit TctC